MADNSGNNTPSGKGGSNAPSPSTKQGGSSSALPPPATTSVPSSLPTTTTTPQVMTPVTVTGAAATIPAPSPAGPFICREMLGDLLRIPCMQSFDTLRQYVEHLHTHTMRRRFVPPAFTPSIFLPTKVMEEQWNVDAAGRVTLPSRPEITARGTFDPAVLLPSKLLDEPVDQATARKLPDVLLDIAKRQSEKRGGDETGTSSSGASMRRDGLVIDVNEAPKRRDSESPPKKVLKIDVNKTPTNSSDENESSPSK